MAYKERFTDIESLVIPSAIDRRGSDETVRLTFGEAHDDLEIRNAERAQQKNISFEDLKLDLLGKSSEVGRVGTNAGGGNTAEREAQRKKDDKSRADAMDRAQLLLERMRAQLDLELEQIELRRDEIGEMRAGIEDVFANGYEVGEDGKITNEQAEKALKEYEERTGTKVDRNDETAVLAALHAQWEEFDREEREMDKRAREIQDFQNGPLKRAEEAQNDPSLSEDQKAEIAEQTVEQGIEHGVLGAELLETHDTHIESGRAPDVSEPTHVIVKERDMILGGI